MKPAFLIFSLFFSLQVVHASVPSLEKHAILEKDSKKLASFTQYVFDPDFLRQIFLEEEKNYRTEKKALETFDDLSVRKDALGKLRNKMVSNIVNQLKQRYPGAIIDPPSWAHNFAGAALFDIYIIACGMPEYILFDFSGTGTGGYTGNYDAEIYDFIIDGQIQNYLPGEMVTHTYKAGSYTYHYPGLANGFAAAPDTLLFEYARGDIAKAMDFGIMATYKNGILDKAAVKQQLKICMGTMIKTTAVRSKMRAEKKRDYKNRIKNGWDFSNLNFDIEMPVRE